MVGAAIGGAAGSILGADLGLIGGAAGGVAGYVIQRAADKLGGAESDSDPIGPRVFGGILTDTSEFVGRKAELRTMAAFFSRQGSGVCLLYGFGGCGKSATLKVFTEQYRLLESAPKLKRPPAVFLWSFSQDPNLERFFNEFRKYIDQLLLKHDRLKSNQANGSYLNLPDLIQRSGKQIILILDGIESVTVEDEKEVARDGSLAIPALRVLLQRTAEGGSGSLRIFCTSRVIPPELKRPNADAFQSLDLSKLPTEDGLALLRKKGTKGSKKLAENVVADLRHHAYSVALMGDLLRQAYRGDIRQADQILNTDDAIGTPLHRILAWYQARLELRELTYLQTVSLFRTPATNLEILTLMPYLLKTRSQKSQVGIGAIRVIASILRSYGLIFEEIDAASSESVTSLHPIIREYFYQQITNPAEFHKQALRIIEAAVPEHPDISNARQFALLQELVFQALGAGEIELAWKIYSERIGGYPKLGYELADHPSGTKLVDMFFRYTNLIEHVLPSDAIYDLYVDGALYLKNEGRLDDAIGLLHRLENLDNPVPTADDRPASTLLVLAGIEFLRGEITTAAQTIRRAMAVYDNPKIILPRNDQIRLQKEFLTRGAVLKVIQGKDGINDFIAADQIPFDKGTVPHDYGPIRHVWALTLHGDYGEAEKIATKSLTYLKTVGANMLMQRLSCMAALNSSWAGDFDRADFWSNSITAWALKADIHVAVLNWLQRGVYALRHRQVNEAERILSEGAGFAGDSGFLLEWLDMMSIRAYISLNTGNIDTAFELATMVINGSEDRYLVPLKGAISPAVEYVWPLAPALAIYDMCKSDSANGSFPYMHKINGMATVYRSQNYLLHTVMEELKTIYASKKV